MANTYIRIGIGIAGSGSGDTFKVKVSTDDTTSAFLEDKITLGSDKLTKEIENPGIQTKLSDGKVSVKFEADSLDRDTDIYALAISKIVSVTPLSLDMTSKTDFSRLEDVLKGF